MGAPRLGSDDSKSLAKSQNPDLTHVSGAASRDLPPIYSDHLFFSLPFFANIIQLAWQHAFQVSQEAGLPNNKKPTFFNYGNLH
jgi:hypothetical protein